MNDDKRGQLVNAVRETIVKCTNETDLLSLVARLIDDFSDGYNWTGFYMMKNDHLEVGPYIGPETTHTRITLGNGICGAAALQKRTVTVDDVSSDPRFLACSLTTRSEIVVPLMDGNTCLGEIDIDSDQPSFFTNDDRRMLEAIAEIIVARLIEINE